MLDVDRERRAVYDFVWDLRPSTLRWPFLAILCALVTIAAALILTTGIVVAWFLTGVLAVLLLLVVVMRLVLKHSLLKSLTPAVPDGSAIDVTLDASGWHSQSSNQSQTYAWQDYDRAAVAHGYLIVTASWKGKWIPRSLVYAPLVAFGDDAAAVPEVIASFLPELRGGTRLR
ncbi:hypothetical protein ACL9RL_00300 [Plantibacter sp. Mn2098]|uniref:hypothetical protein n=1 Tax=Plantibacter sp. Mn2098 TaxID=3395266 RepID=UPI003BDB11FB